MLPLIRVELIALQRIKKELDLNITRLQQLRAGDIPMDNEDDPDPFFTLECRIEFAQLEAQAHMANISQSGAELKDIEIGLVDFPAWKDGIEVLLCWRMGEDQISYYHGRESGFMSRRPIDE